MKKEMVEKIESEITQKTKLPDNIKEQARKNIFTNIGKSSILVYAFSIGSISFFIFSFIMSQLWSNFA